ncbi:cytochrome P450 [Longispora fulva]|uniref:Cytochrome P450 n=1 Tax=Longispora fulva TaxID=619741 RepID=A0A8J7GIC1_9ACTN|nr:cytochrome P450 [Longispora fulva]MBG6136958.1 cytochrome P450 [Longispora fulva]GIG61689.1 cytochrome P450 [Longispora fulva]
MTDTINLLPTARTSPLDPPPEVLALHAAEGPVSRLDFPNGKRGWLVTGFDEVRAALIDPRLSARGRLELNPIRKLEVPPEELENINRPNLLNTDPPDHTRLRRMLTGLFTVRRMRALSPRIEEIVADHLDAMATADGPVDLVSALALPVPSLVICELLGVPYDDRTHFQGLTATLLRNDSTSEEVVAAGAGLREYMMGLVKAKRANPDDGLLSELIQAEDTLTDIEAAGTGLLLLIAGHETTANMIGLGTFTLLSQPERWAELRDRPELIDHAVEELLRYLTIVHFGLPRTAAAPLTIGDQAIAAGDPVLLHLSAANRDPAQFDGPEFLDFHRESVRHIAFGYGVHQCLGQQLARNEMIVVFRRLIERFPELRLAVPAEEVPMRSDMAIYGVHRLPVLVG